MMEQYEEQPQQEQYLQDQQLEQEQEQVMNFRKIEELESFGVNKNDINKLKQGGFHTIESVSHTTLRKLTDVKVCEELNSLAMTCC